MTLLKLIEIAAGRPDARALARRQGLRVTAWTYGRLRGSARQLARVLEARGLRKGDRVLLWAANSPEWVAAFFGCLLRGCVVVPLDRHATAAFARRVAEQVDARLLIRDTDEMPGLGLPGLSLARFDELVLGHSAEAFPVPAVQDTDLAEILFTSGTTAEPKGVCLTHRNILANLDVIEAEARRLSPWLGLLRPLRFLCPLPLSHAFGQYMGMFVPLILGGEVYFDEALKPSETIDFIRRCRISVMASVPRQLEVLASAVARRSERTADGREFSVRRSAARGSSLARRLWTFRDVHNAFGWRFWAFVSGAAALNEETEEFWRELGFAVLQGYGMTEAASIVTANHPLRARAGTIGKALSGREVRLGEDGEILVRGDNVSPGYWERGVAPLADAEGWLHTGDLGEVDEQGSLRFRGRRKDVIVTAAGLNVHPQDIEAALAASGEVESSAVIPFEGPHGPEPLAVLILRAPEADPAKIVERANASLAPYQQVRRWIVWPERDFPRTAATGKVVKTEVAEAIKASLTGRPPSARASNEVDGLIGAIAGVDAGQIAASATLEQGLGLDSLGRVELLGAIEERFGTELDEGLVTGATTVAEVQSLVAAHGLAGVPSEPYARWGLWAPVRWARAVLLAATSLATRGLCRLRVQGAEGLREVRPPLLVVSNHVAAADPVLILSALPSSLRGRLAIAMDGERLLGWRSQPPSTPWLRRAWSRAWYGFLVACLNVFPLARRSGFRRSFAFAGEAMDLGYSVLVFPEGRRTEHGGLNPFKGGIGLLARGLGAPVVPARIQGLYRRRGLNWLRPGRIAVRFGRPVRYEPDMEASEIAADLERRVAELHE